MASLSVSKTDRFVIHVASDPERIRNALMQLKPRPWLFVVQTDPNNKAFGYDIYMSNEFGGYPNDEAYERVRQFAENLVCSEPTVETHYSDEFYNDVAAPAHVVELLEADSEGEDVSGDTTTENN